MAINPMQRKSRNSFLLGVVITLIICGLIIGALIYKMVTDKKQEAKLEAATRMVYVLTKDVKSGEQIFPGDFRSIVVELDAAPGNPIDPYYEEVFKPNESYAKVNMTTGTIITSSLVYIDAATPLTKDIRIQQYNMFVLQKGLEVGDYIDVRFILPTGEDYIVASRKRVIDVSERTVWLAMSEQETLTMSCAIYESYLIKGSALYTTVYVDPGLQGTRISENGTDNDPAFVTYATTGEIAKFIMENPNILRELRKDQGSSGVRDRINDDIIPEFGEENNIPTGVAEQIRRSQEERKKYWDELNGGY